MAIPRFCKPCNQIFFIFFFIVCDPKKGSQTQLEKQGTFTCMVLPHYRYDVNLARQGHILVQRVRPCRENTAISQGSVRMGMTRGRNHKEYLNVQTIYKTDFLSASCPSRYSPKMPANIALTLHNGNFRVVQEDKATKCTVLTKSIRVGVPTQTRSPSAFRPRTHERRYGNSIMCKYHPRRRTPCVFCLYFQATNSRISIMCSPQIRKERYNYF